MLSYSKKILFSLSCHLSLNSIARTTVIASSSTYEAHERSRFMQKLINKKGAKNKKQWYKPHLGEPLELGQKKTKKGISVSHSIRLRQLSHVLYDKITEIINTGELSQDVLDAQVAITSASMTKDMSCLNIYWDADRTDWELVEQTLQSHSGKLRSLLISYHILGRIPHIAFVKSKAGANLSQLNQLFDIADYGPDYIPRGMQPPTTDDSDSDDVQTHQVTHNVEEVDKSFDTIFKPPENPVHGLDKTDTNIDPEIINVYHDSQGQSVGNRFIDTTLNYEKDIDSNLKGDYSCNSIKDETLSNDFPSDMYDDELNTESLSRDDNSRSNLYGLDQDEMMKKIVAKKLKSKSSFENDNINNGGMKSFEFDDRLTVVPNLDSLLGVKRIMRQKQEREERKNKLKLLERDSFD